MLSAVTGRNQKFVLLRFIALLDFAPIWQNREIVGVFKMAQLSQTWANFDMQWLKMTTITRRIGSKY